MWLVAINPTSGQGRGARFASEVVGFLKERKLNTSLFRVSALMISKRELKTFSKAIT